MKRTALFAIMIVAATVCVNAQLLWKISGNGVKAPSYLFGTQHMAPVGVLDSVPGVAEALSAVDMVYGELSLEELTSPSTQQQIMIRKMTAPADSTLDKIYTPAELAEIDSVFTALVGMPVSITQQLNGLKPAMLSTVILATAGAKTIPGFNPAEQLDKTLLQRGQEAGKPVKGLETLEFQSDLLYNSPIAEQAADVLKSIRMAGGIESQIIQLNTAYLSGNLEAMLAIMENPETGMDGEAADRMINNRNAAWVDFLIGMLPTSTMLIVVGAGHLPGAKGVISGLRKAGYTVEPVTE